MLTVGPGKHLHKSLKELETLATSLGRSNDRLPVFMYFGSEGRNGLSWMCFEAKQHVSPVVLK